VSGRPAAGRPPRGLLEAVAVAGLLLLYVLLAVSSLRTKSSTFDELAHLSAGWTHLALGDYRLSPDHPPLVKKWAALPLKLFLDVRMREDDEAWRLRRPWEFGRRWLYRWNDADTLLLYGRSAMVALALVLLLAVWWWARRLLGARPALAALALAALSPDLLAHGQLVTTDLGIALFVFVSVAAFEVLAERLTAPRLAVAGLLVGAAFATKPSALALVPILGALGAVVGWSRRAPPVPVHGAPRRVRSLAGRLGALALAGLLLTAVACATLWSAYGFRREFSRDPAVNASFDWRRLEPDNRLVALSVRLARRLSLLPDPYLYGFLRFFRHSESRPSFLLGRRSEGGSWLFFPVTFALKTPLPLMALLGWGLWRLGRRPPWRPRAFLVVPVAIYLLLTLSRGANIGHRHLLPIYPFLFVIAAAAVAGPSDRPRRGLSATLLAWYALGTLRVHPHYLAYFNELGGGPRNGYRHLADSSLDWGQDLKGLRAWLLSRGDPPLKLSYFGTADPEYYHLPVELLPGYLVPAPRRVVWEVRPGDLVAVSATNLACVYLDRGAWPLMERLRRLEPLDQVGYSILIHRADFAWRGEPASSSREAADP
jgi:hypothetical protein